MLLKVGELARQSGLTVRTLHHYDEIGLLVPSGRSESGYRLYSQDDVARLHGIQALRQLGLPLSEVAAALGGEGAGPAEIIAQQMNALERQIVKATELRARLGMIQADIARGGTPDMGDWLQALSLMETYGKYFSAGELKKILSRFEAVKPEWLALMVEVRALMDGGAGPDSVEAQSLARRWMSLVHHWMEGDFGMIDRWGEMYTQEPTAHGKRGGPPSDMHAYMSRAAALRLQLMTRYFDTDDLRRLRHVPESEWREINEAAHSLMAKGVPAASAGARALAARCFSLLGHLTDDDPVMLARLLEMNEKEPLLGATSPLGEDVREYLRRALDPHAT